MPAKTAITTHSPSPEEGASVAPPLPLEPGVPPPGFPATDKGENHGEPPIILYYHISVIIMIMIKFKPLETNTESLPLALSLDRVGEFCRLYH